MKDKSGQDTSCSPAAIDQLIAELGSRDKPVRLKARNCLTEIGETAVRPLVDALASANGRVRWEAGKLLGDINVDWSRHADAATIGALMGDLASKDGLVRVRARCSLVAIGPKAAKALVTALSSKQEWMRWEAAKALGQIGDATAIEALMKGLEDEMFDVRWLSAEGLIAIGRPALAPLLQQLAEKADSLWLREGAHHVLRGMDREDLYAALRPVLAAIEDPEATLEVPIAAEAAIKSLADVKVD